MEWYFASNQQQFGPVSETELVAKFQSGELPRSTLVWNADLKEWVGAEKSSIGTHLGSASPPPLPGSAPRFQSGRTAKFVTEVGTLTDKVIQDIRELMPQFLMPLDEVRSFRWVKDTNFLLLAGIGLSPLLCLQVFDELKSAYWALALYFSALWALFFYRQFPSHQVTGKRALACFFGTGLVSITVLLLIQKAPPLHWIFSLTESSSLALRFAGMFGAVALWEEACKLIMVLVIVRTSTDRQSLQTVLFYGLMAGLGFGIYEGVSYQTGRNLLVGNVGTYYLLNVVRLTTLPFLHAVWTGIGGYFIGLSVLYPKRKHGLIVAALLIPSLMHALHNTLGGILSLAVDFVSVLALIVYLRQSSAFEEKVQRTATERIDRSVVSAHLTD